MAKQKITQKLFEEMQDMFESKKVTDRETIEKFETRLIAVITKDLIDPTYVDANNDTLLVYMCRYRLTSAALKLSDKMPENRSDLIGCDLNDAVKRPVSAMNNHIV